VKEQKGTAGQKSGVVGMSQLSECFTHREWGCQRPQTHKKQGKKEMGEGDRILTKILFKRGEA